MAEISNEITRNDLIIATAISSLDFSKMSSLEEIDKAVATRITTVERLMSPKSHHQKRLNCVRIPATIEKISFEDSSQRFIIDYVCDNAREGFDGHESVRSERVDAWNGNNVRSMWQNLQPGDSVIIYKLTEEIENPKDPKHTTVRISPFVHKQAR